MKIIEAITKEKSPLVIIAVVAAMAAAAWFFWQTRVIWGYVLIAVGIAYLMSGPANKLSDRGLPRSIAVMITFVGVLGIIVLAFVLLFPMLQKQAGNFARDVPNFVEDAQKHFHRFNNWLDQSSLPDDIKEMPDKFWQGFQEYSGNLLKRGLDIVLSFFSRFYAIIIIPICTFYLLLDVHKFHESFLNIFSPENKQKVDGLLDKIDTAFGGFIRSRLKLCLVVGIGMIPLLAIFKVPYPVILGLIAGVCEFVPYVGPVVGAIPALLVGLISGKLAVVLMIVLVVQVLENAIFVPKIMGSDMGLHPLVVILALLTGGQIAGAGGMILSVPLVAAAKILVQFVLEQSNGGNGINGQPADGAVAPAAGEPPPEDAPGV